jgi:hypothetical protein
MMAQAALKLPSLTYAELAKRLELEPSERLVALLNERSIKVGDTAADLLSARDERALLLDAAMSGQLTTRNGKVRAVNFFCQRGRRMPEALPAFLRFIHDSNPDVVSCALFGLVFWNDPQHLSAIRSISNPRLIALRDRAIAALEAHNPKLYSPGFIDVTGAWA